MDFALIGDAVEGRLSTAKRPFQILEFRDVEVLAHGAGVPSLRSGFRDVPAASGSDEDV